MSGNDTDVGHKRIKKEYSDGEYDSSNTLIIDTDCSHKSINKEFSDGEYDSSNTLIIDPDGALKHIKKEYIDGDYISNTLIIDTHCGHKRIKKEYGDGGYESSNTVMIDTDERTLEEEERRRRRREHKNIAATKWRKKTRERMVNLLTEREVLENQNQNLKGQIKDLEVKKRKLIDMMKLLLASCVNNNDTTTVWTAPSAPYGRNKRISKTRVFKIEYSSYVWLNKIS